MGFINWRMHLLHLLFRIMFQKSYKCNFKNKSQLSKQHIWQIKLINYNEKKIIIDGSHNIDGAYKLKEFLKEKNIKPIVFFGMLNNKNINDFLLLLKRQIKKILLIKFLMKNFFR